MKTGPLQQRIDCVGLRHEHELGRAVIVDLHAQKAAKWANVRNDEALAKAAEERIPRFLFLAHVDEIVHPNQHSNTFWKLGMKEEALVRLGRHVAHE